MQFTKKVTSAIAAGALLFSMTTPVFAEEVLVTGNGAGSLNTVNNTENTNTNVGQSNDAVVKNVVSSNSNSGGNSANFNTGGDTTVVSGAAKSTATVTTAVNANSAEVTPCGGCTTGAGAGAGNDSTISGNGAGSFNTINQTQNTNTNLGQSNDAYIKNYVDSNANSGNNSAAFNTGGDVTVASGLAESLVGVLNAANVNVAKVGGSATLGAGAGLGASALISGNGAGSLNSINLVDNNNTNLGQSNHAAIKNYVSSNANSGNNDANFNTGGDTTVVAGAAHARALVDNLANFNSADLGCGCLTGASNFKIAGNGANGFSTINNTDNNNTNLGQSNLAFLKNRVNANGNSGNNSAAFNVGAVNALSDPAVISNQSWSETSVSNLANWNGASVGTVALPGGGNLNLMFNFAALLGMLHMI